MVAGAVAIYSVEHDLKGKYHKKGLHCLRFLQLKERKPEKMSRFRKQVFLKTFVLLLIQHKRMTIASTALAIISFFIQVEDTTGGISCM